MRGSGWENTPWKPVVLVEEGEVVVEHPVCYTGGKELDQSEPVAVIGFEAEQRTAPSDYGRESPEAAAWESVGAMVRGSGQEKRVTGWDATLWGSEEPAWVLQACSVAGWSDLVSEADCRCLRPSLADWEAGQEDQESRVHGLGSFEDLEMGNLSVQVYLHPPSHHLCLCPC